MKFTNNSPLTQMMNASRPATCPVCYQCSTNPITSTPSDLIITFVYNNFDTIRDLLVSIRSIGIRSTVYLITVEGVRIPKEISEIINSCDINTFYANNLQRKYFSFPEVLKYFAIRQFLEQNMNNFTRILDVDSQYTYFQGDPFTDTITQTDLHIVLQDKLISSDDTLSSLFQNCYASNLITNTMALNKIIGGSVQKYFNFVILITNELSNLNSTCLQSKSASAQFNELLWMGETKKYGISHKFHNCNSDFVDGETCCGYYIQNEYGVFVSENRSEAIVFTNYAYYLGLSEYISRLCSST